MAETIKYRFRCRRRTAVNWTTINEILLAQEIGLESDTGLGKIGDGVTPWNDLLYSIVGQVDLTGIADGKCLAWDETNGVWKIANRGAIYQPGTGIAIDSSNPEAPIINSTLGSLSLTGTVPDYASLPSGLGPSDDGDAYLNMDDNLVYVWDGSAWPIEGNGLVISGGSSRYDYTNPDFSKVSSLLHFDGPDNSTTITDQVSGNIWTASGGAKLSTAWASAGSASLLVAGSGNSCVSMPTNSKFDVGNGDWTIQFTYRYIGNPQTSARIFQTRDGDFNCGISLVLNTSGGPTDLRLYMSSNGSNADVAVNQLLANLSTTNPSEILIQRKGLSILCAVNGFVTYEGTVLNNLPLYYNASHSIIIGGNKTGTSRSINANIDEFRFVKGLALLDRTRDYPKPSTFPDS